MLPETGHCGGRGRRLGACPGACSGSCHGKNNVVRVIRKNNNVVKKCCQEKKMLSGKKNVAKNKYNIVEAKI